MLFLQMGSDQMDESVYMSIIGFFICGVLRLKPPSDTPAPTALELHTAMPSKTCTVIIILFVRVNLRFDIV